MLASFFNGFPWSDKQSLNLDWILQVVKKLSETYPEDFKAISAEIEKLSGEVETLTGKVENFDYNYISGLLEQYIPAMIYPEITDSGYIAINVPESWDNIIFNTTGLDIILELQPEYGHLVLSY